MGSLADAALRMELEDEASRQSNPRVFREYDTAIAGLSTRNKELLAALREIAEMKIGDGEIFMHLVERMQSRARKALDK